MKKKFNKICIITGSRAEYGLLFPLMNILHKDSEVEMKLIVTGSHLSPEFGMTVNQILSDGFIVDERIEMLLSSDSPVAISKSMGLAIIGFGEAFARLKPEIIVLLGDRYEILCAASAALIARIPVAHLHGGERTEGAYDESIRHAVTKLSHVHFASLEEYRKRILQLGENPERVFTVGAIGIDNIRNKTLLSKKTLSENLRISFKKNNFLVTFHPETLEIREAKQQGEILLNALLAFEDTFIVFTKANADTGGRIINKCIDLFVEANPKRSAVFSSLGQERYLSLVKVCNVVIGNSSSGIIEVPSMKVPTVNIGDRQKGRIKARSVIDCPIVKDSIVAAIKKALSSEFQSMLVDMENPYGDGKTAERIANVLKTVPLDIKKPFFDR